MLGVVDVSLHMLGAVRFMRFPPVLLSETTDALITSYAWCWFPVFPADGAATRASSQLGDRGVTREGSLCGPAALGVFCLRSTEHRLWAGVRHAAIPTGNQGIRVNTGRRALN